MVSLTKSQSCILVIATKQIHVVHNCIINCSSSFYHENEHFQKIFREKCEKLRNSRSFQKILGGSSNSKRFQEVLGDSRRAGHLSISVYAEQSHIFNIAFKVMQRTVSIGLHLRLALSTALSLLCQFQSPLHDSVQHQFMPIHEYKLGRIL